MPDNIKDGADGLQRLHEALGGETAPAPAAGDEDEALRSLARRLDGELSELAAWRGRGRA